MSRNNKRIALILAVSLVVLGGVLLAAAKHFFASLDILSSCEENIEREVVSPNKRIVATVFVRNCGATTDYVTHINLRQSSYSYEAGTNGVIAAGQVWHVKGKVLVKLVWKNDHNLEVELQGHTIPQSAEFEHAWGSVNIRFR